MKEDIRVPLIGAKSVYLFKQNSSQIWWGSWKLPKTKRIFRSLRTEDLNEATKQAHETYDLLLKQLNQKGKVSVDAKTPTIKNLVEFFYTNATVMKKNGDRARQIRHHLDRKIIPYLGPNYTIKDGDVQERILLYPNWRRGVGVKFRKKGFTTKTGRRPQANKTSLKLELQSLKQCLKFAAKHRLIESAPVLPLDEMDLGVKLADVQKNRRPDFTTAEVEKIPALLDEYCRHDHLLDYQKLVRQRFAAYTKLLIVTGARPAEVRSLRLRNCRFIERNGREVLIIDIEKSKTVPHSTPATFLGDASVAARWMKDFLLSEACLAVKGNDLIFTKRDGKVAVEAHSLNRLHENFLRENRLLTDKKTGRKKRTFYSYRHHFATFNLRNGVPLSALASSMGNSPDILQKYYNQNIAEDLFSLFETQ
jgi:integrase